jgi:hypothetical protein
MAPVKLPFTWPKSSDFEQRAGQRAAVHADERLIPPRRVVVDRLGDHLLAGAGLAEQQHRRAAVGDLPDDGEHFVHRGRVADDVLEAVAVADLGAELRVLLEQLFLLPHHHAVDLDRLREERGDDVEELMIAVELQVGDERLVDRQRPHRAALNPDRHTEEADRHGGVVAGGETISPIEEVRLVPQGL